MVREILVETFVKYYSWRNRRRHPSLLNFFSFFVFVFVFLSATSLRFVCCFVCWYIFSLRFAPLFFSFFFFFHSPLTRSNQLFSAAFLFLSFLSFLFFFCFFFFLEKFFIFDVFERAKGVLAAESILPAVQNVQKPVLVFILLVYRAH